METFTDGTPRNHKRKGYTFCKDNIMAYSLCLLILFGDRARGGGGSFLRYLKANWKTGKTIVLWRYFAHLKSNNEIHSISLLLTSLLCCFTFFKIYFILYYLHIHTVDLVVRFYLKLRKERRISTIFFKDDQNLDNLKSLAATVVKPNSWTYNFVEVSGHNLESSWDFCIQCLYYKRVSSHFSSRGVGVKIH